MSPNQMLGAVAIHGHVGKGRVAVAPYTIAAKVMKAELDLLLGHQPAGIGAEASTPDTAVKGTGSRRRSEQCTRVDALAEIAAHGEDFVVSPAGLECRLDDEVRGNVGRVVGVQIVETATRARTANQEVAAGACAACGTGSTRDR